ncbi:MAG TPA: ATP-grasp domain-containing protein [Gemmatimonadaceae bacterium]|nr:ATP-grasp domain-containing protein [Gemmatimonadaceae bacterium]
MKVVILHNADALEPPVDPIIEQLSGALGALGHETEAVVVDREIDTLVGELRRQAPDLVFNITESFRGKSSLESSLAGLLNLMGCRYTGSSPAGLLVAGDKGLTKKVLSFHSIQTPEFATLYRGAVDWVGNLSFPVIVKPPQEDASLGITSASVVREIKDLFARIDELQSEYQTSVLVEQFIEGREFYIGVLGNANPEALPVVELDFSGFPADRPRIASWNAKWGEDGEGSGAEFAGTRSIFPSNLAEDLVERMQRIAVEAFNALRLRDYARIDLRVSDAGEIYVIEVNPNCYLERESDFSRAAKQHGLEYDALIARIVDLATARYSR